MRSAYHPTPREQVAASGSCGGATIVHKPDGARRLVLDRMSVAGFRLACMAQVGVDRVDPWRARRWWLALMTNAIGLVDDAAVLTVHCSYGRAQALLVLATEELARARSLYDAAEDEWSRSIESDMWVEVPAEVTEVGGAPQSRLQVATRYPAGMTAFWEPDDDNRFSVSLFRI